MVCVSLFQLLMEWELRTWRSALPGLWWFSRGTSTTSQLHCFPCSLSVEELWTGFLWRQCLNNSSPLIFPFHGCLSPCIPLSIGNLLVYFQFKTALCPKPGTQHFYAPCITFLHLLSYVVAFPHFNYKLSRLQALLFLRAKKKKKYSFSFLLIFIICKNQSGWIWGKKIEKWAEYCRAKPEDWTVIARG